MIRWKSVQKLNLSCLCPLVRISLISCVETSQNRDMGTKMGSHLKMGHGLNYDGGLIFLHTFVLFADNELFIIIHSLSVSMQELEHLKCQHIEFRPGS